EHGGALLAHQVRIERGVESHGHLLALGDHQRRGGERRDAGAQEEACLDRALPDGGARADRGDERARPHATSRTRTRAPLSRGGAATEARQTSSSVKGFSTLRGYASVSMSTVSR